MFFAKFVIFFWIFWTRIFLLRQLEKDQKPFVCCAELFVSIQSCNQIDWTKKCISYMNSNILNLKLSFLASHLYIRSEACCANLFCWDHCIEGYNCSSERVERSRPPSTPTPPYLYMFLFFRFWIARLSFFLLHFSSRAEIVPVLRILWGSQTSAVCLVRCVSFLPSIVSSCGKLLRPLRLPHYFLGHGNCDVYH